MMQETICYQLKPGDIFTISTDQYIRCLEKDELDYTKFKLINHYKKRFIPRKWYKKLMFWQWIKMVDLVDIEFVGNN